MLDLPQLIMDTIQGRQIFEGRQLYLRAIRWHSPTIMEYCRADIKNASPAPWCICYTNLCQSLLYVNPGNILVLKTSHSCTIYRTWQFSFNQKCSASIPHDTVLQRKAINTSITQAQKSTNQWTYWRTFANVEKIQKYR